MAVQETPSPHWMLWLGALVLLAGIVGWGVFEVQTVGRESRPSFLTEPSSPSTSPRGEDDRLHIAGSGSCIPLTRMLAGAAIQSLDVSPEVHASIGSGGGLRALRDGAIDVAVVSRRLRSSEDAGGLVYTPFARIPVVVAAGLDVPERGVSFADLEALFSQRRTRWSDGSNVVLLLREPGDSSHRVVEEVLPTFAEWTEVARSSGDVRVLYHDSAMQVALANTPGAIGLHGNGVDAALAGFRALAVEGAQPTTKTLESGEYPFVKELAFVTMGPPSGEAEAFIDFALSTEGRSLLRIWGAVPPQRESD